MKWSDCIQHGPVYFFNVLKVSICKMLSPLIVYALGDESTAISDTDPFINLPQQISALEKSFTESAMLLGTICEAAEDMRQVLTGADINDTEREWRNLSKLSR